MKSIQKIAVDKMDMMENNQRYATNEIIKSENHQKLAVSKIEDKLAIALRNIQKVTANKMDNIETSIGRSQKKMM